MMRRFSPGDIVGVYQSSAQAKVAGQQEKGQAIAEQVDGVIYKVNNSEIVVSFTEMHDFENFK